MTKRAPILVVDDSKDDVFLLCRAFKKAGLGSSLIHVRDGEEAVDYLTGENPFTDRSRYPLPRLMLLDIKMPKLDGFDVLRWLLTRKDLETIPVVMFSSSFEQEDVEQASGWRWPNEKHSITPQNTPAQLAIRVCCVHRDPSRCSSASEKLPKRARVSKGSPFHEPWSECNERASSPNPLHPRRRARASLRHGLRLGDGCLKTKQPHFHKCGCF